MDLQVLTCPISMAETVLDTAAENAFDLDIHLPEYYPDIQRILRCTVTPNIHAVTVGQDRVNAEGSGVMRMLYAAEDKKVVSFEQTFPISKSTPWKEIPEAAVTAFAKTDFVNCRASGQRKATVHGVVSLRFRAQKKTQQSVVIGAENPCLQMRRKPAQAISLNACAERNFAMSEVVEVGAQNPPVSRILRSHSTISVESVKAIKDKLLVKGELLTDVLYAPESGEELCSFRHAMPVSQILEAAGIEENNVQDISLQVVSLETTPKADGSGEQRLLEIAVRVQASVRSGAQIQMQTVQDAYTTEGALQAEYQEMEMHTLSQQINDSMTAKQTFDLTGESIASLLDAFCGTVQTAYHTEEDTVVFTCETTVSFLYRDMDGNPAMADRQMTFTYRKILPEKTERADCMPVVQISGCKASLGADGKVEVKLEILLSGTVYAVHKQRVLVSAQAQEETAQAERPALTIYFTDPGEAVWDIARRYKTTAEAILAENELTGETIDEKRMLIIPRA